LDAKASLEAAMAKATVLVVDEAAERRQSFAARLKSDDYRVLEANSDATALLRVAEHVDVVLLNHRWPDNNGVSLLRQVKALDQDVVVVLLTADASSATAVEAMKCGADHFASRPLTLNELSTLVERALETTRLRREVRRYRASAAKPYSLDRIVGNSPTMTAVRHLVARIATSPASTVLLTGESGTGKDLVARVLHFASERSQRPFMNITCSAVPHELLERELFGHERGAFTDANLEERGLIESADGGTVFLDEISETAPAMQARLLRFLEDKTFRRVGGTEDIHVDVRVVAASNRDLEKQVDTGSFRADLYYRLNVVPLALPALRTHLDDLPLLTAYFIDMFNAEFHKRVLGAGSSAYTVLQQHGWPGNVRELRNVLERAVLLSNTERLERDDFEGLVIHSRARHHFELPDCGLKMDDLEKQLVLQALSRTHGNQTRAGSLLGLNRDQIRYRIEKFGLTRPAH
jgi:two-component system response regulator AtoC